MSLAELAAMLDGNKSCRFARVLYRAKESGELAWHTILLNVNRMRCLKVDLANLKVKLPTLAGVAADACQELITSIEKSLNGTQDGYTKAGYYSAEGNGNVQVAETGVCYVRGYSIKKEVIEPGTFKAVKSAPKTVEKNKLRKGLKNTRVREFRITPENFVLARGEGKAIVIEATGTNLNKLAGLPPVTLAVPVPA